MATGGGSGFFECTICLEDFQEPKLLPCFHTFCKRCLSSHIEKCRRRNHFPCPNCRTNIKVPDEEADGFQTNFYVTAAKENLEMKLLDIAGGTNKDCDLFAQLCPKHGNKNQMLQFYCTRCDIPICLHCKLTSHEGHNTKDLDDVIQKATDELKEESNKLQVCILKFATAKKTAEDTEKKNDKKLQDLRATIIRNAEELHEMVDNRKTILLDLLTKFEKKKTNKLVQYRKSLDKQRKSLEELGEKISSDKHDIMTLFQLKSTVAEMMNTLKTTPTAYSSNTDEVDYVCSPNLRKKAHKMISSFMGQVTIPNLNLPPEHLEIVAAMRAASSSTTYDMPCRTPTLLRKIWAQGRSKYIVRNLSADHNGCLWAIYNPLSPDVELLNKHGATLKKLTIDAHDISGLTFVPDNKLYVCCPSQNVFVKVDDIFSEAPTTNVKMNLPGSPIATCQYNQQVYVLIWGNKRFSEKGIYCPNTSKWLITNFEEYLMRKPFDFVVTKVGRKMTIIVSDPLSKKVFYFQQGKYQYDLLNVFQREGYKQSRFLPRCISLTNKGHLLVADEYNNCVVQLDIKTGKPIGVIHLESIFIKRPRTIRYTNEGTWIGDAYGGLYLIEYDSSNS